MADATKDKEPSGISRLEDRAMKVIAWVISMVIVIVGAVLYLEHRHQSLVTTLAEIRADMRHMENSIGAVDDNNADDHEKIYRALEALNANDRELALQVMGLDYCCNIKPVAGKKSKVLPVVLDVGAGGGTSQPKGILPWNIAMKGPGIEVQKAN